METVRIPYTEPEMWLIERRSCKTSKSEKFMFINNSEDVCTIEMAPSNPKLLWREIWTVVYPLSRRVDVSYEGRDAGQFPTRVPRALKKRNTKFWGMKMDQV